MARKRQMLLVAALDAERKRSLGVMAGAADLELTCFTSLAIAMQWIEANDPHVVVFDTSTPKSEKLCERIRSRSTLARVPIIGLSSELNDALAAKLFAMGVDDVIASLSGAALMTRLRVVPAADSLAPPPDRGLAVVADPDRVRCDVFGRVLLNAGYEVKHAYDGNALRYYATKSDVRLIVANAEIAPPRSMIEDCRQQGSTAVWIATAQRRDVAVHVEALSNLPRAGVFGVYSPPENLLFTSNELLAPGEAHARESPRMLYGTIVAFRPAGATADDFGFCYNVSRGGLYVRTLAPPEEDSVWLELRPPKTKQSVRLEGRVAWRRAFGPSAMATAPPGFGVEIVDWLGDSLSLWQDGYSSLADVPADSVSNLRAAAAVREANAAERRAAMQVRRPATPPPSSTRASGISAAAVVIAEIEEIDAPEPPATAPMPPVVVPPPPVAARPPVTPPPPPQRPPQPPIEAPSPADAPPDTAPSGGAPEAAAAVAEPAPEPPPPEAEDAVVKTESPSDSLPLGTVTSPPDAPHQRSTRVTGVVVVGGLLAAAAAVLVWATARGPDRAPSTPAEVSPAAPVQRPAPPTEPAATAAPSAVANTIAAAAVESAAPAVAASAESSGDDGSDLPITQGYLIVRSSADADVYATGFKVGKSNTKNRSPCNLRWVRLGTGDPPHWLSPGRTLMVKCRGETSLNLEPGPGERER